MVMDVPWISLFGRRRLAERCKGVKDCPLVPSCRLRLRRRDACRRPHGDLATVGRTEIVSRSEIAKEAAPWILAQSFFDQFADHGDEGRIGADSRHSYELH